MKTKTLFLFIMFINFLSAQSNFPCLNDVSTDFTESSEGSSATNNSLPQNPTPIGQSNFGERFLNSFNWYPLPQPTLPGYLTSGIINLSDVDNTMLHIYNTAYGDFYKRFLDEKNLGFLPIPSNGWELLAVNLGYYPNGEALSLYSTINQFNALPYIILYNKFSGKIRLFAKPLDSWVDTDYWSSARVIMSVSQPTTTQYANGLLRYASGRDIALDQPTSVIEYSSLCAVNNQKDQWLSADFSIAFDPCVCDWPSRIRFDFELVQNVNLELYGGGIEIEKNILNNNQFTHTDYFSNFTGYFTDENNEYAVNGGLVLQGSIDEAIETYLGALTSYRNQLQAAGIHNAEVERRHATLQYVKVFLAVAGTIASGGSGGPLLASAVLALGQAAPDLLDQNGNVRNEKVIKESEKYLAQGVKHFTSSNWKKIELPKKPTQPTVSYSEMRFTGLLTSTANRPGPQLLTPGSYGSAWVEDLDNEPPIYPISSYSDYPVYNEMLGVFALLESPKIIFSEFIEDENCQVYVNENNTASIGEINFSHIFQFKLKEDLKYVFNPKLNIKNYSIDASLSLLNKKVDGELFNVVPGTGEWIFDESNEVWIYGNEEQITPYNNPSKAVNVSTISYDINETQSLTSQQVSTIPVPIDAFKNVIGQFGNSITYGQYGAGGTGYQFCELVSNQPIEAWNHYSIDTAYLTLTVNIQYDHMYADGTYAEEVLIFNYLIDEIEPIDAPLIDDLPNSILNFGKFEEDLYLDDITFQGQDVFGCTYNGIAAYHCSAWNDIYITGEISVESPNFVSILATNEIVVDGESVIHPNVVLDIFPRLISEPMPPATTDYVQSFCKGQNQLYQANTLRSELQAY